MLAHWLNVIYTSKSLLKNIKLSYSQRSIIMGRLTHEQTAKIVRLRERNMNIGEIVRTLADDDCKISSLSVRRFLRRFQERQSFKNAPLPGRPAEDMTPQLTTFVKNPCHLLVVLNTNFFQVSMVYN